MTNTEELAAVRRYYADHAVRSRIGEYCGAHEGAEPTAAYVAALHSNGTRFLTWGHASRAPYRTLDTLLPLGPDLSRSLWDTKSLIFILDLDHMNVDLQADAFLHPIDTFFKLEPVFMATAAVLGGFGIRAFRLVTGRGYHFVGRIRLASPLVAALAGLAPDVPSWFQHLEARRPPAVVAAMTAGHARAATGLGLITEYLAHLVLQRAAASTSIPVVFNGTVVGRGALGRECVSIDFSHIGDPLDIRTIRVAFSAYQWHRVRPDIFGPVVAARPPLAAIPRGNRALIAMLRHGRELDAARRLARDGTSEIPDISDGLAAVLEDYRRSRLAHFHETFASELPAARPPAIPALPPCVNAAFEAPNDLLLKPGHIQHVVRALMARGWTPAQIAREIAVCYQSDWKWGDRWNYMDRETRASFDVRVFAGLIDTGLDRLRDYNCVSAQEKGLCTGTGCSFDLRDDRDRLLEGLS